MVSINLGFTLQEKELIDLLYSFYQSKYPAKTAMQGLFIMGGFIRDRLAGLPAKDLDFLAYGLLLNDLYNFLKQGEHKLGIKIRFPPKQMTHENASGKIIFGFTAKNLTVDVVQYFGKLKDDLASRDFKCNSLAYDIFSKKLIDYYGGFQDIQKMIIRPVESFERTFVDNYTRFLRMLCLYDKGYKISEQLELQTQEYFASDSHFPFGLIDLMEIRMTPIFNSRQTSVIFRKASELKIIRSFFDLKNRIHENAIESFLIATIEKIETVFEMKTFKEMFAKCPLIINRWSELCRDMKRLAFPVSVLSIPELQNECTSFENIKTVVIIKASQTDKNILNELLFADKLSPPFNKEFFAYINGVKFMGRSRTFPFLGLFSFFRSLSLQDIEGMKWLEEKNFRGILNQFERVEVQLPPSKDSPRFTISSPSKDLPRLTLSSKPLSHGLTFLDESEFADISILLKQLSIAK